ncbi:MAG: hypothetical protein EOO90_06215 [Pedobacter sp.]|nr:MAG: hypothetical protein EOO90_06215 [Pedobacter sp.]
MTLFDIKERGLEGPAAYNSNAYAYYNDSARSDVAIVRETIGAWFDQYPQEEKEEMKARFKVSFDDTFYELYIYTLFSSLGYTLTVHPEIPNTLKRPDFKAKKGSELFYIEVKCITMLSQTEKGQKNRENVLLDGLNQIDASNFLLNLRKITFKDQSQPSNKLIIRFFNDAICKIDPDQYEQELGAVGYSGIQPIVYEDERVLISLTLFPKSKNKRGINSRAIGSHPFVTQIGNDSDSIRTALESKATRYGKFGAPYVICINKQSISLDIIELQESLYGSMAVSWSTNPADRDERLVLSGNGFFGSSKNKKFTRVSGVYLTNANTANLVTTADHAFRHNPFAEFPIALGLDTSIQNIFKLNDNYPYG